MDLGDIYLSTSPSGKQYIGQCVHKLSNGKRWGMANRWLQHVAASYTEKPACRALCRAIRKYGAAAFVVERLWVCAVADLNAMETHFIKQFNTMAPNGYNLTTGGGANSRQSEETKQLRRESMMGKNVGKVYARRKRLRPEDSDLPKYLSFFRKPNGEGYRVMHHPGLKTKYWISGRKTMAEKLALAQAYIASAKSVPIEI